MINVKTFGAGGLGCSDDTAALQAALFAEDGTVRIPSGRYIVSETLLLPSHKRILADPDARIVHAPVRPLRGGDFLLSNADPVGGNEDVELCGGIWDGGFGGRFNVKNPDLFAPDGASGACLNFVNVRNLRLRDLTAANSVVYFIRMARLDGFEIQNVLFTADRLSWNQDGLHFGGEVRNGLVENVRAENCETNDDLIALNADDSMDRIENHGLVRGDIENLTIRNVYAENCYTAVRMLSVTSAIRNVTIENLYAGCRCYALNLDAARFCRTPLFREEAYPDGVGRIENVRLRGIRAFFTEDAFQDLALIHNETVCRGLTISGFERPAAPDRRKDVPTLLVRNVVNQTLLLDGEKIVLKTKADVLRRLRACGEMVWL